MIIMEATNGLKDYNGGRKRVNGGNKWLKDYNGGKKGLKDYNGGKTRG